MIININENERWPLNWLYISGYFKNFQACRSRTDEAKSVYDFVDSGVPIRIQSEDGYEAQPCKGPTLSTHHNPVVQCGNYAI